MITVIIYDAANGRPLRTISCADVDAAISGVKQGEAYIVSSEQPQNKIVREGRLIDLPPKPFALAVFDYDKCEWDMDATLDAEMQSIRARRQKLLQSCDWTQVPDAPVDQAAWAAYRQALRDLPSTVDDPQNVVWPTPPQV